MKKLAVQDNRSLNGALWLVRADDEYTSIAEVRAGSDEARKYFGNEEAFARLLVHEHNVHEELVEALRSMIALEESTNVSTSRFEAVMKKSEYVLNKARAKA